MTLTRKHHQGAPVSDVAPEATAPVARAGLQAGRVAEAVGYVGGVLGGVGVVLLVNDLWADLSSAVRIGLPAVALVALLVAASVAGRLAGTRPEAPAAPLVRLRTFLWLAAVAAAGATAAVAAREMLEHPSGPDTGLAASLGVMVVAVGLWAGRARPLPQFLALGSGLFAVGLGLEEWGTARIGLTLFLLGAALAALGFARRTSSPWITLGVGSMGALVGAGMMCDSWKTVGFAALDLVVAATMAAALLHALERTPAERRVLLGVAFIGAWIGVPQSLGWFAQGSGSLTGLGVWVIGAAVVAATEAGLTRAPRAVQAGGALMLVGGAALIGVDSVAVAVLAGLATALALLTLGAAPHRMPLSMVGVVGLLVDVPWAILHFLPGDRRAPVAIVAAGLVLVTAALYVIRRTSRPES